MGTQERYFGRWLLPVFPILCVARRLGRRARRARRSTRRAPTLRPALLRARRGAPARPGARLLAAQRTRPVARRHPQPRARMDGGERPAADEDRRRARRPRRLGAATSAARTPATSQRRALDQVPDEPLEHRQRRLTRPRRGARREHRGLRAHARPRLVDRYEKQGWCYVVSGSTQRGRAEVAPQAGAAGDRLLQGARAARGRRLPREPVPARGEAGRASTSTGRFDYYPLAYAPARTGDDDLPAPRWAVRAGTARA